jgi:uncharacterized protein YaaN involved in tellurite resistance
MSDSASTSVGSIQLTNTYESIQAFSPKELGRINDIKKQLKEDDPQGIISFGVRAQRDIADFADSVLNEVRKNDTGSAADVLNSLVAKVKETGIDTVNADSFLAKMPIFGGLVNPFKRIVERYENLSVQIEKISDELERARMQLMRDITMLDIMYAKNLEYKNTLDIYIAAGQMKLTELEETNLPALRTTAEQTNRQEDLQQYNDLTAFINNLGKKITDLKLSRMIALQTAPQIRLIQSGSQALAEKIQSSIVNTIPLWKNQVVIAITLLRQKKALKLQKNITATTNALLEKNADVLKDNSIGIANETAGGVVEIETLKKANENLIATIEGTLAVQASGKEKRLQAEQELARIEEQLKGKLSALKS